jgi:hypothetical protein
MGYVLLLLLASFEPTINFIKVVQNDAGAATSIRA